MYPKGNDSKCKYKVAVATNDAYIHKYISGCLWNLSNLHLKLLEKCLHNKTQNVIQSVFGQGFQKNGFIGIKVFILECMMLLTLILDKSLSAKCSKNFI